MALGSSTMCGWIVEFGSSSRDIDMPLCFSPLPTSVDILEDDISDGIIFLCRCKALNVVCLGREESFEDFF